MKTQEYILRTGEIRLDYIELGRGVDRIEAVQSKKGWAAYIVYKRKDRIYNCGLKGIELRTFPERTVMTKWVKSHFVCKG